MDIIFEIHDAIQSLRPNSAVVIRNDDIEQIDWSQDTSGELPLTKEEILAEVQRLQAEHDKLKYARDRLKEYPSYADQFDLLYHGGYDAWKSSISSVKNKYPKS